MPVSTNLPLKRFLSDFTLGFSDGLTVPFALTAGLSSLGRTDTVIFAGLAELCAGSISMGVGGYLAALDELPAKAVVRRDDSDEEEMRGMLDSGSASAGSSRGSVDEKEDESGEEAVRRHLEPLSLPPSTITDIISALQTSPSGLQRVAQRLHAQNTDAISESPHTGAFPIASGLSISLGYVVGGVIPLCPYVFAATVEVALRWSIALCLLALLIFGAGKSWVLGGDSRGWRGYAWGGGQTLVLGSLAAGAAVLSVRLLGGRDETRG